MKISAIKIKGFKCFRDSTTINLDETTCFVGNNGSGKSTVLEALCRLFGDTENKRKVKKSDFYVEQGKNIDDYEKKDLFIEAKIEFPELKKSSDAKKSIPLFFQHLIIEDSKNSCCCKVLLTATWEKNNSIEGNIESNIYWNHTTSDSDNFDETDLIPFYSNDKNLIRVYYIPAIRNPENQIKNITGSTLKRLFDSIYWNEDIKKSIEELSSKLNEKFQEEQGIIDIQKEMQNYWSKYTIGKKYRDITLTLIGNDMSHILSNVDAYFSPGDTDNAEQTNMLSDGIKSIFYLTLLNTLYSIENNPEYKETFDISKLKKPILSIFALEEPENHLAPHYLGKILAVFRELNSKGAQTIITSHSPAIVKRVDPTEIRYFQQKQNITEVKTILLPPEKEQAYKYVKEAVRAYPELYFSKLVILGEGDSEELIIPKLATFYNINLDQSFISFIPLGGRFVNHFWRLLENLEIPYITLLDFDKGRNTGGDDKFKYLEQQLQKIGKIDSNIINSLSIVFRIFISRKKFFLELF